VYTSTVPPPLNLNGDISPSHSPSKKGKSVSPRRHVIISEASKSPTSKTVCLIDFNKNLVVFVRY
jgi:hypothetical protein